jgi:beta-1,4-mannosyl-glycoprotein beta-1,4-N-acetylglucosaminyltransferase
MIRQYTYGFEKDALHFNNGEGSHMGKDKRILKTFQDRMSDCFLYVRMLVDCFMFYNELDVLEARLTLLDEYVDLFVLVEAEVTHLGGRKALYFEQNKERFSKWLPKIKYVLAKNIPGDRDPWSRGKHQRNCIMDGLTDVPKEAIVMISDVDEIPDMRQIRYEKLSNVLTAVHMHMFAYSLKYYFTDEPSIGTVITTRETLTQYGPNLLRDRRWQLPIPQVRRVAPQLVRRLGARIYKKFQHVRARSGCCGQRTPRVYRRNVAEGLWGGKQMPPPPPEAIPPLPEEMLARFSYAKT